MRISDWSSDVCSSDLSISKPGSSQTEIDSGPSARVMPCPRSQSTAAASSARALSSSSAGSDLLTLGGGTNVFGADSLTIETGGGPTAVANKKANGAGPKAGGATRSEGRRAGHERGHTWRPKE